MKKIFTLLAVLFVSLIVYSQTPIGFSYQAVLRDGEGNVFVNQAVQLRISLTGATGSPIHYSEVHSLTTNEFGLVNLVVGQGDQVQGVLTQVPWDADQVMLKLEVKVGTSGSFLDLGLQPIQAVPYALYAGNTKAIESDPAADDEDPIFVVRNKEGQIVFAVYQSGVRIYVDDTDTGKRPKGGFAVGGFSTRHGKDEEQNFLMVTPDSTRVSFKESADGGKRPKGGFAVGGFSTGQGNQSYLNVTPSLTQVSFADDGSKRPKGGFAVGGFSTGQGKGEDQNYLMVTPDSTRVFFETDEDGGKRPKGGFAVGGFSGGQGNQSYLNVTPSLTQVSFDTENTKRPKGGFAVGGFSTGQGKEEPMSFFDITMDETGIINPAENRVLWYPQKNAFMAGRVLVESPDSIGTNSFASGYESRAMGDYSTAIGHKAVAQAANSFAFGEDAYAQKIESYAFGREAKALGIRSFAFGSGAPAGSEGDYTWNEAGGPEARGDYSYAFGMGSVAQGWGSFAIGFKTEATDYFSTALGVNTEATGQYSTAMGFSTKASGISSTAMGSMSKASGDASTATGYKTTASGERSSTMGSVTTAPGYASTAMGSQTVASGYYSTAMGEKTTALGAAATAMGAQTWASGNFSTAMGYQTSALGNYSIAMGQVTVANSLGMVAIGRYNVSGGENLTSWVDTDPVFTIGIGTGNTNRMNAVTVLKGGQVGLRTVTAPTYALHLPNITAIGAGRAQAFAWDTYSDTRVKSNQQPIQYGLAQVMRMVPKTYFHHNSTIENGRIVIAPEGKQEIGLVAQEMYDIVPEVVSKPENEQVELWGLSYEKLVPVLIKAIQEQQQLIEQQQEINENQQKRMEQMQKEIELLKQK